ncbi:hypothetical protein VULLAG_LOCUS17440 [Vulpes lagopus]
MATPEPEFEPTSVRPGGPIASSLDLLW